MRKPKFVVTLILGACTIMPCMSGAADIPFADSDLQYNFREEPLDKFLNGFFVQQGVPVELSAGVLNSTGTLNGPRGGSPEQVLDSIASSNQLLIYYDGNVVYVYKPKERVTSYYTLTRGTAAQFQKLANELGLGDANNTVTTTSAGVISVSGAPSFVARAAELVEVAKNTASRQQARRQQKPKAPDSTLRYFKLKYAWADDTTINVGYREVTVPGVASLLRRAMGVAEPSFIPNQQQSRPSAKRLGGSGLASVGSNGQSETAQILSQLQAHTGREAEPVNAAANSTAASPPGVPNIVADPYHNSILIRDKPERMSVYEDLIAVLDVEPHLVEIKSTIIDIDKRRLKKLGINLRVRATDGELVFGPQGTKDDFATAQRADNVDFLPALGGLNAGVIVGNSTLFAARLNALEDEDVVSVVSRPQVITLSDMEASIASSREVFVPVGGSFEVDLFEVVSGTMLRVTPHVIDSDNRRQIRLSATIEDGDVELVASRVQRAEFPVVDRNSVTTQAVLDEGQSLLLGGLTRDSEVRRKRETPVLRKIPIVRALFKERERRRDRTERLFLITPRLVSAKQIAQVSREALEKPKQVFAEEDKKK
jgi:type III secretion protein C